MFGYLRFFLALLVVVSHLGIRFWGLNPGVFAVVIFYILAGYVLAHLYFEIIPDKKNKILLFYKERILRIFPLYLYILFLTILFLLITDFANPHFTLKNTMANLTIIPLNYYMYFDFAVLEDPHWWLIPPAWSLGTELQAYFVLALLFLLKKRYRFFIVGVSFFIYTLANFSVIHADYFGYRLLAGVLFIFYMGVAFQRKEYGFLLLLYVSLSVLGIIDLFTTFNTAYAKETLLGTLVGFPIFVYFAKTQVRLPYNALFGTLSYGLFLAHFLIIWITTYLGWSFSSKIYEVLTVIFLATFVAYTGTISVERYVKRYRMFKK